MSRREVSRMQHVGRSSWLFSESTEGEDGEVALTFSYKVVGHLGVSGVRGQWDSSSGMGSK